jgi:hypothetical protein
MPEAHGRPPSVSPVPIQKRLYNRDVLYDFDYAPARYTPHDTQLLHPIAMALGINSSGFLRQNPSFCRFFGVFKPQAA